MKKLDNFVTGIYRVINEELDIACPEVEKKNYGKCPWYNKELKNRGRRVSNLYKKLRNRYNKQNLIRYQREEKGYKKACKKVKNQSWRKYKETMRKTKTSLNTTDK
jgi:hypothetical protein